MICKFHEIGSQGPLYICTCCDQLWYKHSVLHADKLMQSNPDVEKYLCNKLSFDDIEWVCTTCYKQLSKNRVPPCAVANGTVFPNKPPFFDLNELECRLLAPRIAFQKLMQAPRGKQLKIHGNVVNVPADVVNTVSMLPWLPSETGTVKVNLKRKLQYKSSAMSLNVRPHKVVQAAHWLTSNSDLYKDEGVALNADWIIDFNGEILETESSESACHQQYVTDEQNCNNVASHNLDDEDKLSEDEVEVPEGVTDTML